MKVLSGRQTNKKYEVMSTLKAFRGEKQQRIEKVLISTNFNKYIKTVGGDF